MQPAKNGDGLRARRWQAQLAAVLAATPDAVVTADEAGQIESFDPVAEGMFGYPAAEVLGRNVALLMPEPHTSRPDAYIQRYLATGRAEVIGTGLEAVGRRKDGSAFPIRLSLGVAEDPDGPVFAAVVRDLTDQKLAEADLARTRAELNDALDTVRVRAEEARAASEQLWQAAKLAAIGELAAGIAHELNNPLATVGLRVEALLRHAPPESPDRHALEVVTREVERMGHLVAGLLQFGRRGAGRARRLDVRDELRRTLDLVHHLVHRRRIEVAEDFAPDAPSVHADPDAVRQVFLNLLTNALDAMSGGGKLTLRVARATLLAGPAAVAVEIGDTGPGIPPALREKVWDPFFTTKEEGQGTGLGLPVCRRVVEENGGAIELDGAPGRGTVARVVWPIAPPSGLA